MPDSSLMTSWIEYQLVGHSYIPDSSLMTSGSEYQLVGQIYA